MASRLSPAAARRQRTVETNNKRMRWLDEAANPPPRDSAAFEELRDLFPKRRLLEVPPTERELVRQQLAARLRNLETLAEELREVIDVAGEAVTVELLESLQSTCGEIEGALQGTVERAAQSTGLAVA
ncbi:MAG: hypothetical protein M3Z20_00865 [Chloroflexota bacterium]|nr:hypothetical protein [Chloroflexota bacterium]